MRNAGLTYSRIVDASQTEEQLAQAQVGMLKRLEGSAPAAPGEPQQLNSPAAFATYHPSTANPKRLCFVGRIQLLPQLQFCFILHFDDTHNAFVKIRNGAWLHDEDEFDKIRDGDLVRLNNVTRATWNGNTCLAIDVFSAVQPMDGTFSDIVRTNAQLDREIYPHNVDPHANDNAATTAGPSRRAVVRNAWSGRVPFIDDSASKRTASSSSKARGDINFFDSDNDAASDNDGASNTSWRG